MSKRGDRQELESTSGISPRPHPTTGDSSVKAESTSPTGARNKRRASGPGTIPLAMSGPAPAAASSSAGADEPSITDSSIGPPAKKSRTNTPWTPAEEQRLKNMRDAGNSWAEIAKVCLTIEEAGVVQEQESETAAQTFPSRTEGSVKKHWYKDMHYAEFAEDESQALLNAIKEYETNKWKVIGAKVGKPAKACEQYAKENFAGRI